MKKALIIGGAGFIGHRLAKHLSGQKGYAVTIIDNFFRGKMDDELKALEKGGVKIVKADCTDAKAFSKLGEHYDCVYMLAAVVGVGYTEKMPAEIIRINTLLMVNLLEWLKTAQCRKVIFSSTSECYAGSVEKFGYKVPTDEEVPLCIADIRHPRFTYAATKMLGESGLFAYAKTYGFIPVVARYHNVYGERMGFKHVIPQVVKRFYEKENPFSIIGGEQTRSFCYVDDAVQGTVLAMESSKGDGEIFHIGAEEEITVDELVRFIGSVVGFKGRYSSEKAPSGSVSRRCPDISKARKLLGYRPAVGWKEGVKKTVQWYWDFFQKGGKGFE
ncbi:NAD-dependent epimerase/dehydratase family protein [Candidatus Woesearchaeota archaeon]|nr:NAD-dependent epimerase/dehydratase family protein [Candidatus Woesearchaeota archaeon]